MTYTEFKGNGVGLGGAIGAGCVVRLAMQTWMTKLMKIFNGTLQTSVKHNKNDIPLRFSINFTINFGMVSRASFH